MANTKSLNPMPRIGVDMYTIFKVESDSRETGAKYAEGVQLPGTVEIAPTDNGATDNFDADNGAYAVEDYLEKMGHEITNADIPPEIDALMRGIELKDGGVEVGKQTKAPYFGVAWRVTKLGGGYRLVRYYKGKYGFASAVGAKTKPSEGASEKQTAKATFSAVAREADDSYYYYLDTDDLPDNVTEETALEKWFTDMNWYPSTVAEAANLMSDKSSKKGATV